MNMKKMLIVITLILIWMGVLSAASFADYTGKYNELTPEKIAELKNQGSDINAYIKGYSILMWATLESSSPQLLKDLIIAGADKNKLSEPGENLLMMACFNRSMEVFDYVLTLGINPNATTSDGASVLMYCIGKTDDIQKIGKLLKAGAKTDLTAHNGTTALLLACRDRNFEVVRLLIENGANINQALPDGGTPLMYAINSGANPTFIGWMLDKGADASKKTTDGYTAYSIARNIIDFTMSPVLDKLAKAAGIQTTQAVATQQTASLPTPQAVSESSEKDDYHEPLPAFKLINEPAKKPNTTGVTAAVPKGNNVSLLSSIKVSRTEPDYRMRLAVKGNYLFASAHRDTLLHIYNVANPAQPVNLGAYNLEYLIHNLAVYKDYLYISSLNGLYIVDISKPESPKLLKCIDSYKTNDNEYTLISVYGLAVIESTLYGSIDEGVCSWDITDPVNPTETHFVKGTEGLTNVYANAGWVIGLGNYPTACIINTHDGVPEISGKVKNLSDGYSADMNYYNVFVGTLRGLRQLKMEWDGKISPIAVKDSLEAFTAVTVVDSYLLSVGSKSGLKIYDISYEGNLTPTGSLSFSGSGGILADNRRIYASGGNTIYILDCAKAMPVRPEPAFED